MKRITDDLRKEHEFVKRLRDVVKKCSDMIYEGKEVPFDDIKDMIIVIEQFIDRCHHGKEECVYFPSVTTHDASMGEESRALVIEHELGRRIARFISKSLEEWRNDNDKREPLARFLRAYVDFLNVHTDREERFFDLVDSATQITEQEEDNLGTRFENVKEGRIGPDRYELLISMVESLERKSWAK